MWRSQGWGCRPRRPLLCHNGCRDITQVVNTVTDLWHVRNESILSNKMTSGGLFLHQRPPSTGYLLVCYLQYDCSNEALWDHLLIITWHPTVQIVALVVCCVGGSKYHLVPHTLHYTIVCVVLYLRYSDSDIQVLYLFAAPFYLKPGIRNHTFP